MSTGLKSLVTTKLDSSSFVSGFFALLLLCFFSSSQALVIKNGAENWNNSSDTWNSNSSLVRDFGDKIGVEYPELVPGRPITAYLIVGILFVSLTILPYILYGIYIVLTPGPSRFMFGRRKRSLSFLGGAPWSTSTRSGLAAGGNEHLYDPHSWNPPSNSIGNYNYNSQPAALSGNECIERIICRVSRRARKYGMGNIMESFAGMSILPEGWRNRLERGVWTAQVADYGNGDCSNFHCQPFNSFLSDWNANPNDEHDHRNNPNHQNNWESANHLNKFNAIYSPNPPNPHAISSLWNVKSIEPRRPHPNYKA